MWALPVAGLEQSLWVHILVEVQSGPDVDIVLRALGTARDRHQQTCSLTPCWPEDRYLELAPLFWSQTRPRIDPAELEAEVGWITVPDPIPLRRPAEESPAEDRA